MKRTTKAVRKPRVERTRNGGTETQSSHMGKIRSALRNISRWWKPFGVALQRASSVSYVGRSKRVAYLCSRCQRFYDRKNVEVNHIVPVGSLKRYEDLPGFCERLFVEDPSLLEVVCKRCHKDITGEQRADRE